MMTQSKLDLVGKGAMTIRCAGTVTALRARNHVARGLGVPSRHLILAHCQGLLARVVGERFAGRWYVAQYIRSRP